MINNDIGKSLIVIGIVIVLIGLIFTFMTKGGSIPKLPGDIYINRDNFALYFPWVTSIILSIILTIIFSLLNRK